MCELRIANCDQLSLLGRCIYILGRSYGVSIRGHRFRFVGHVFAHMQSLLIDGNESEERKRGQSNCRMQIKLNFSMTVPKIFESQIRT
jgi:hypothetical protein